MEGTRSKFNVGKKTTDRTFEGIIFDSVVEMKYYRDVVLPEIENGNIVSCERQKKYILQPSFMHLGKKILPIEYKADFVLKYKTGKEVVVDIKGCPDAVAILKRKMFWYVFPNIDYIWIGYSKIDGGFCTYEDIKAGRKQRKKDKKLKEKLEQNEHKKNKQ